MLLNENNEDVEEVEDDDGKKWNLSWKNEMLAVVG